MNIDKTALTCGTSNPEPIGETILMVDDVREYLTLLREALEPEGYNLLAATSGEEALRIASRATPDLILLDIVMKGIDGIETCRRLKAKPETAEIPVIFVTIKDEIERIVSGFKVGGVDYITKPVQKEELLARVKTHLKIRHLTKMLLDTNVELAAQYRELQEESARRERTEKALEGITGLALEIVEGSHRARSQTRIPFPIRLQLHTRIVQNWYEHFVLASPHEEELLSTVVREALKQAFKYRCEGYLDVEKLMGKIDQISDGQKVSIEVPNYIGSMTCYLSHPQPVNVRKPYILQAVLKSLIDNSLKSLRRLRERDAFAKAELRVTSCVSEDDYIITIYDSGEPFNEETIQLLQQPQKALVTWMKEQLEALETTPPRVAEKSYRNLPVGLGLLLSQLILTELYNGRMQIKNEPEKSVSVRCENALMASIDEKKGGISLEPKRDYRDFSG